MKEIEEYLGRVLVPREEIRQDGRRSGRSYYE